MEHCVLALGFFDGVHLGHGGLLRRARERADQLDLPAVSLTFDRHPAAVIRGQAPLLLNTLEERAALMQELYRIDRLLVLPFDEALRNASWEDFAGRMEREFGAVHIICGHDFRFGKNGEGTPQKLEKFCREKGLGFDCIEKITLEGITVSSTHIRALLQEGQCATAVRFLGHGHLLSGKVIDGRKVGRTLGVPTANLEISTGVLLPKNGVYAAEARLGGETYAAVVNIGCRPTFGGEGITVEPWLLDFNGDLYGRELQLRLYEYLRPERKFGTPMELKAEILRNADQTRDILRTLAK